MQITTSKGKTFDVGFIGALLRDGNRMMIELADARPFAEIAADFDGLETIKRENEHVKPGVISYEIYEGFTQLVGMQRNRETGAVRLTLERNGAA